MSALRREDGQTATEYAGILAVIALIFVALGTLGLGGRVSGTVKDAACIITGCKGKASPGAPARQGNTTTTAQNQGPPPVSDASASLPSDPDDLDGDGI